MRRPRGTLYLRGTTYWIQFYRSGVAYRESTGETKVRKAEAFLQKRLAEVSTGTFLGSRVEKVRVGELADDLLLAYETGQIKGKKSIEWAKRRWNLHLKPFFGDHRAVDVGTDLISRYVQKRQTDKAENATINRELSFLKRAFRFALTASPAKLKTVPHFPHLTENNARQGFLSDADYEKLATECGKVGLWMRAILAVGYNFAWRKGEVLNLRVKQIDLPSRTIRLEQGTTKNGQGRIVKMTQDTFVLLSACVHGKQPEDYIFTRDDGKPVLSFRGTWKNVCTAAGVPELLYHDLRRSGARNLRRLGVAEGTILKIGGWLTPSVMKRYDIVDVSDLEDAASRLDEKREQNQHKTVTIPESGLRLVNSRDAN